jgi:hypothetical protein
MAKLTKAGAPKVVRTNKKVLIDYSEVDLLPETQVLIRVIVQQPDAVSTWSDEFTDNDTFENIKIGHPFYKARTPGRHSIVLVGLENLEFQAFTQGPYDVLT